MELTKQQMKTLRYIGQVDDKYLMAVVDGGILVAIDQHAADERLRLENFPIYKPVGSIEDRNERLCATTDDIHGSKRNKNNTNNIEISCDDAFILRNNHLLYVMEYVTN